MSAARHVYWGNSSGADSVVSSIVPAGMLMLAPDVRIEAPTPTLQRGRRRADAELAWLEAYPQTQVFRLAGIYGPGRGPFEKVRKGTARRIIKENQIFGRAPLAPLLGRAVLCVDRAIAAFD